MHRTLAEIFICRRASCGTPAARPNRRRATPRRVDVVRCPEYLAWLRTECKCVACELTRKVLAAAGFSPGSGFKITPYSTVIDPAHGPVNGLHSKGPDDGAIPLCRYHHDEMERLRWPAFEAEYEFNREHEAKTHFAAFLIWKELNS